MSMRSNTIGRSRVGMDVLKETDEFNFNEDNKNKDEPDILTILSQHFGKLSISN